MTKNVNPYPFNPGKIAIEPKPDPPSTSWWIVPPEAFTRVHRDEIPRILRTADKARVHERTIE